MTDLKEIPKTGISPGWPTRKKIIQWVERTTPWPMDQAQEYNARVDVKNSLNIPPNGSYYPVGVRLLGKATALALSKQPWEREMVDALGYLKYGYQLYFFWHREFRKIFQNHPSPLRMLSWESITESMAMNLILGKIDEAVYLGYMAHATLNQGFELELSYKKKHRRCHAFMLRLFADWRGDAKHDWPAFAYEEPIYENILKIWRTPDPDALSPWLMAACDYHTHQAKADTEDVFHDCSAFMRTPLEILIFFRLRELLGLQNPVLDHPLMESPFDRLPEKSPDYVPDEFVQGTLKRVREDWPNFDQEISLASLMEASRSSVA